VKSLEVRVPHELEPAEVCRRLDDAVSRARQDFADKVSELEASWESPDRMRLLMVVMGMKIDSSVEVLRQEAVVRLQVPGMAGLFAGRIRSGIEERLGGLLATG